ncbi:hypothetical protein NEMBOFW57_009985 [Staphylotrichum longicolle]|uniref:Xylanolytic transcriptional activator regulatory domain-containing protein n=1 Tax=Staphylotrichum longicolle TaxID=669026 RepID=A0AAD4EQ26_9PEZI|nr:hypothetical protein NEMBOFW57_009985 [Staphylotrichum longicolle]
MFELHLRQKSTAFQIEKRCKALAKVIKARRAPPWPCVPTPELPAKVVSDALIECYLRTNETLLRVLHIPSFRRDYEAVWSPDSNPDPTFLVLLKLVLAIGATTYDESFSLRPSAVRWVYEAHTWLSAPDFKHRLGIPSLQANILLLIARQATGVGEDLVWASVGSTLRIAMYMGLHRDPAGLGPSTTTPMVAEMRRRLWNTILEIALESSLNSGGAPLISLDHFDTEPPGNFDDDQLTGAEGEVLVPKPDGTFSQTTTAIALRSMFPQRLAIVKYLNDLSSRGSYAETLKLDTELRAAYKTLTRTLQTCKTPTNGPSDLELRAVDLLLRHYFVALHLPFFAPALKETEFAFSRRVVVESALRLWRAAFPVPLSQLPTIDDPLARVAISGSGYFRTIAVQASIVIAVELTSLMREEESLGLGPVEVRPDLLTALDDFKVWSWKGMETGETNTKGYLVACLVWAQVDAMRKGMVEEEWVMEVVKAAEEAETRCLGLLEEIEARGRQPQDAPFGTATQGVGGDAVVTPDFGVGDWDYMMSDVLFNTAGDPLSWVFQ